MKLPAFEYRCPTTLAEAVALLAGNADARPLAGGQSLIPIMAFRLAAPSMLVDLRRIPGLGAIRIDADGVHLGALVRWRDIEESADLAAAHPLLREAVSHVGHYQIRNRGTVGGSLANADPAAELPGIAVTCDAVVEVAGAAGARTIPAARLFVGPLTTSLRPDEIITGLSLPPWPRDRRWAFLEFAQRRGDFALGGIAAFWDPGPGGVARNMHIGAIGAAGTPRRLGKAERALEGNMVNEASIAAAASAASAEVDPSDDFHASAAYRRALIGTLLQRALASAAQREAQA